MQTDAMKTATKANGFILLLLGLLGTVAACSSTPKVPRLSSSVTEASGLVVSRTNNALLWTHSDDGPTTIFAVDRQGRLQKTVTLTGASHVDWEDIAQDDSGRLYVGDIGNRNRDRTDLVVYRIPEPAAATTSVPVEHAFGFQFPNNDRGKTRAEDAEALFWARGSLFLLTKTRDSDLTTLFRFPTLDTTIQGPQTLVDMGSFDVGPDGPGDRDGRVTGADISADASRLAVLTYHAVFVFAAPPAGSDAWLGTLMERIDLKSVGQVEGIAWDGNALLVVAEEGWLHRITP